MCIGHQLAVARLAAQPFFSKALHALTTCPHVRMPEHGLQCLGFLVRHVVSQPNEIILAGACDIAQHMREIASARIGPR